MPPWPLAKSQFSITTSWQGTPTRRPSVSRPALMAMQSSPVSNVTFRITTPAQDSGSQPSVFGPEELIVSPSTVTFRQRLGFRCQNGLLTTVTPASSTVSHKNGWIICGGRKCPDPNTRCATGTSLSAIVSSAVKSVFSSGFQLHQWFASACPFRVPAPVTAMLRCP